MSGENGSGMYPKEPEPSPEAFREMLDKAREMVKPPMLKGKLVEGVIVIEFHTGLLSDLDKTEDQKEALRHSIEKGLSRTDGYISHDGGVWDYEIKSVEVRKV